MNCGQMEKQRLTNRSRRTWQKVATPLSLVISEVEPREAERNLDVLESLFDYYFVRPAMLQKKRDALNANLKRLASLI